MDPALGDQEPEAQRILLSRGRNMFHISVDCLFQNGSKKKLGLMSVLQFVCLECYSHGQFIWFILQMEKG